MEKRVFWYINVMVAGRVEKLWVFFLFLAGKNSARIIIMTAVTCLESVTCVFKIKGIREFSRVVNSPLFLQIGI